MFDPLVDSCIPDIYQRPDSFWSNGEVAPCYPRLSRDMVADVVIVGGGLTGLSAAHHLATNYHLSVIVLEANQPGWGASGRSGGFVLPGTGRLSLLDYARRWGNATSKLVNREFELSLSTVKEYIQNGVSCDYHQGGYLKLAHSQRQAVLLQKHSNYMASHYAHTNQYLSAKEVTESFHSGVKQFGGVFYPLAFSVNPWKLSIGIATTATNTGVQIFGNSVALAIKYQNSKHKVITKQGSVTAKWLVVATNAYTSKALFNPLSNRLFPVLSSILVTSPLSVKQRECLGLRDGLMVMDTRAMKFYYRLLDDNRLLFGGRGAVEGKNANTTKYQNALSDAVTSTFTNLSDAGFDARDIEHFWSGWVAVSYDNYPRIYKDESSHSVYSAGYCGAGLAFSIQSGKRIAQLMLEPRKLPELPFWQTPLKTFPFAFMRRPSLRLFYGWQSLLRGLHNN